MTKLSDIADTLKVTKQVTYRANDKNYPINYVNGEKFQESGLYISGYNYAGKIYLINGLPKRVKRAVLRHEVYHFEDKHLWLGRYGKEIRAHLHTAINDPVGFLASLVYSLRHGYLKTLWRLYLRPDH